MIIIVMGVSGSGKSTYGLRLAEALKLPFVEGDGYHPAANVDKMAAGVPLNDADRQPWLERLAQVLAQAEGKGGCVLACSALKESYRQLLGSSLSAKPTWILLEGSKELLSARLNQRRGHFFAPELLASQLDTLERPEETLVIDISEPVDVGVAQILSALRHKMLKSNDATEQF